MHAGQVGHRKGFRVIKWNGWWAQLLNNESADALTLWRFPVGTMDEGSFLCWLVSHMPSKDWDDVQWSIERCTLSPRGSPSGMEGQFHHFHLHFLWKGSNGVYLCKMYMMHGHGNMVHSVSKESIVSNLLTPRLSSFEVPDSCVVGLMPCVVLAFHLK